jgi:hypothetical protein
MSLSCMVHLSPLEASLSSFWSRGLKPGSTRNYGSSRLGGEQGTSVSRHVATIVKTMWGYMVDIHPGLSGSFVFVGFGAAHGAGAGRRGLVAIGLLITGQAIVALVYIPSVC